ncbi:MAG: hypothetical protein HYU66_15450 [Armatimonadetes bacterium]|nr:hypothetical protein [Armatimonadota bacterium]
MRQNVLVDGTLNAPPSGRMVLNVTGNLTINGTLNANAPTPPDPPGNTPLGNVPGGIFLVGRGNINFGPNAQLNTNGPLVVTDDLTVLDRTLQDAYDETDSASGNLPTLVPLPPDDPVFTRASGPSGAPGRGRQGPLPPIVIGGVSNFAGARGDRPIVVFRFNGPNRDLSLNNWTFTAPDGAPGAAANPPPAPGANATGGNGKPGMNLYIWNNGGAINIVGNVVLNLADGGDGSDQSAECATARGGDGSKPGNFRMTARDGIDITNGTLLINPGAGGDGGDATVTGTNAPNGCDGGIGCNSTATGGKGGDNEKRFFVRGAVGGVANITLGPVNGGLGGEATATAGNGGNGSPCCNGGAGGVGTATGGKGGSASLNVGGLQITIGGIVGGRGGDATATGGNGGRGGDCKLEPAGNGGAGGAATSTGGTGGSGAGPGAQGGDGGDAVATGGTGGNGGDSAVLVGVGGGGDGPGGADGNPIVIRQIACIHINTLVPTGNFFTPGVQVVPVFDENEQQTGGTMPVDLRNIPGAQYFFDDNPVPHIGLRSPDQLDLQTGNANPALGAPVAGVDIIALDSTGINQTNPMPVRALDNSGNTIDTEMVQLVLANPGGLGLAEQATRVLFKNPTSATIALVRIEPPTNSFITILEIYILDP